MRTKSAKLVREIDRLTPLSLHQIKSTTEHQIKSTTEH